MSNKLLIFPFGGNSREALLSVLAINSVRTYWEVLGFIDDNESLWNMDCCGVKVIGGREIISRNPDAFILAVQGSYHNYLQRKAVISNLNVDSSRFAKIIHPSASVSPDSKIGYNTLIMSGVFISCGTTIGNNCIVLPNTVISHDSVIGDYTCLGSNVTVSGNVSIGPTCYIGSGTSIRDDISIGEKSLIGLGSNVVTDIASGVVAAGNPAREMRKIRQ